MPLYFFHVTGDRFDLDREGVELPSLSAARTEALQFAITILQDLPDIVLRKGHFRIEVADGTGLPLYTVAIQTGDGPVGNEPQAERPSIH